MINKIECITIECDNCGESYVDEHDSGFSIFVDDCNVHPEEDGWYVDEGVHYCPNCYTIDEDDNVLVKHI